MRDAATFTASVALVLAGPRISHIDWGMHMRCSRGAVVLVAQCSYVILHPLDM